MEGVGMIEKRSKNVVAWRGTETILGDSLDDDAKEAILNNRREIGLLHKEEALLDHWIKFLEKEAKTHGPLPAVDTNDILQALLYSDEANDFPFKEDLVDDSGTPKVTFVAVHTPYDGIAQIPHHSSEGDETDAVHHTLYVGTVKGLENRAESVPGGPSKPASSSKRRKLTSHKGYPRRGDKVSISKLQVEFDPTTQMLQSAGTETVSITSVSTNRRQTAKVAANSNTAVTSSWEQIADALDIDEGAGDFFGCAHNQQEV